MRDLLIGAAAVVLLAAPSLGATPIEAPKPLPPGVVKIAVEDLHCATCARKAARKLYAVKGVREVTSSLEEDLIVVKLPPNQRIPVTQLWSAVAPAGVKPVKLRYAAEEVDEQRIKVMLAQARPLRAPR